MITDAIIGWLIDAVSWLVSLIPTIPVPSWVGNIGSMFDVMFQYASSMGVWVPVRLGFTVAAAVLICVLAGLTIKIARSVLSYFLAGGGSSG